jgi:DNA sulfur modification protein DndB
MPRQAKARATRLKFVAIEIQTQNDTKFYVTAIPIEVLMKVCQVSRADEDPERGYQRLLGTRRPREIADYLDSGKVIPGSLILSAQKSASLEFSAKTQMLSFLNNPRSFLVIDGQHRLYGAHESKMQPTFPVSILTDLSLSEEVQYFNDINGEQKGVPRTLQLEIEKFFVSDESKEKVRINLFHALNTNPDSPLCNRMSATKSVQGKLTHVPFKSAVEPLLDQKPLQDMEMKKKVQVLTNFLKAVENVLVSSLNSADKLSNAAFFQAIFGAFKMIALLTHERHGNYDVNSFRDVMKPLENIKWERYSGTNRQTITDFTKHIVDLIW